MAAVELGELERLTCCKAGSGKLVAVELEKPLGFPILSRCPAVKVGRLDGRLPINNLRWQRTVV